MRVISVSYDNLTITESLERLLTARRAGKIANVTYLNLDCLRMAHHNAGYRKLLENMDVVLPDGIGIRIATAMIGKRKRQHWNVTDFYSQFLTQAAAEGARFFFLGSPEGVAEAAAKKLSKINSHIQVVGCHNGFIKDVPAVIKKINNSGADVLIVGMGAPRQEEFIAKYSDQLKPLLRIGVGALFDWQSGRFVRAPSLFRGLHLEWAWRITQEPKRMARRYLIDGISFLAMVPRLHHKVSGLPPDARV